MSELSAATLLRDEEARIAALHALDLLDTEPEAAFDALIALAGQMLDCPTSLLSLVDRDRQWFKAKAGIELTETDRSIAFCDYTIRENDLLVVPDAAKDVRFAGNPLVTDGAVRFYAGAPIHATDPQGTSHAIGALCVLDEKPRELTAEQGRALKHFATLAEALITMRRVSGEAVRVSRSVHRQSRRIHRGQRIFAQVERMSAIGWWRFVLADETIQWSDGVYRIHEIEPTTSPDLRTAMEYYPPEARARITAAVDRTMETGEPFELEVDFVTFRGRKRRVKTRGEVEMQNGRAVALIGVMHDITDRYRIERSLRESASVDEVTRIANRAAFNRQLERALEAHRDGAPLVLALIDLDLFKQINDTYGHLAGDDVLRSIGQRLRSPFLNGSFAARLGGDEFALILTDPDLCAAAPAVVQRLLEQLRAPVLSQDVELRPTATIGYVCPHSRGASARDLLHAADTALYAAKRERRGTAQAA
ncbi:diguanylate cyclase domain-containing protein [Sphingomonas aracearum]|uniref:Diguanylate cyclase n=1 Tax=Sphingomonas aracearum TaxID=2283317 RepID=A0A369VWC5_9SPHN|nr:diguanylate cyclase [Sphingomonas aracearum]RDE06694.1 diguanylate cyclase [Sphingomonas aracearum]